MWGIEIACLLISFALAAAMGPWVIPLMRKLKVGQTERTDGVETHLKKNGTPTMGGWIFLIPVTAVSAAAALICREYTILALVAMTLLFGLVGFLDDFLKVKRHNKDGLLWYQKMGALLLVSAGFAAYLQFGAKTGATFDFLFWGKNHSVSLGWLFIPFVVFVLLAETNAVNLTDGLDGLCAGSSSLVFLFFSVVSICLIVNKSVSLFSAAFLGALLGFLLYNYHPAKIFMGDTGSLAIGGALAGTAIVLNHPFLIFFAGLLFVFEALSVILQVSYFKLTHGKRIFKMAPLHHHFEKCGWSELKVTYTFWTFVLVCCVITYVLARGF